MRCSAEEDTWAPTCIPCRRTYFASGHLEKQSCCLFTSATGQAAQYVPVRKNTIVAVTGLSIWEQTYYCGERYHVGVISDQILRRFSVAGTDADKSRCSRGSIRARTQRSLSPTPFSSLLASTQDSSHVRERQELKRQLLLNQQNQSLCDMRPVNARVGT